MGVKQVEWNFSGVVPDSLAATIERPDSKANNRPNKRRKLGTAGPRSLAQVHGLSESGIPNGYIPLARLSLHLNFANVNSKLGGSPASYVDLPHQFPVAISKAWNLRDFYGKGSRLPGTEYDCFKLELLQVPAKEAIFSETSIDSSLVEFCEHLGFASRPICADFCQRDKPRVCYQATLHCLPDMKSFRLDTVLLWKDSNEFSEFSKMADPQLEIFSRCILREPPGTFKGHGHARKARQLATETKRWTPRDFYENVHVPQDTPKTSAEIKCDIIECELYPFQRRAVRWLLQREGMEVHADGKVLPIPKASGNSVPDSFQEFIDADGRPYFASELFMNVIRDFSNWYDAEKHLKGGILAEEMGLGKTVEMIALVCLNRRQPSAQEPLLGLEGKPLKPSGATLIITPPAILEQWKQEFESHAPALRVFHYTGIQRHPEISDDALMELLADYDIVLTTYNVLSREVHYTGDVPNRSLRHQKRFEPRRTPLTQIHWWRVCLDEAQMVESGVSNAAKVAYLIPRQNAWAVTGTPLRKSMDDLFGLLIFIHYEPFCNMGAIWTWLCERFQSVLAKIVNMIALRHSKNNVRGELDLPPQKRVVITIPFTAVEEQNYGQLYEQMCKDCGLDLSGAPLNDNWDPKDHAVVTKMRSWLTRLRQTCLHPEFASRNRRGALGGNGPIRSAADVLEVMIDQNNMLIRAEERTLLLSQLRRGQLLENAMLRQKALDLWLASLERARVTVKDCRAQLESERAKFKTAVTDSNKGKILVDGESDNEGEEGMDKDNRIGTYRQRLRAALEIEHICVFFTGNAYYQIRTDPKLTTPNSEKFKSLEKQEGEAYETAKLIRKEMLTEVSQKVGHYLNSIKEKTKKKQFVHIPKFKPEVHFSGLVSRRVLDKFEDFCEAMNEHTAQYNQWRDFMVSLLSQSLIDQEEDAELEGNEYETSTKHQDEMYVYMEALRAMFADRHDALTGQKNVLIAHEVKAGIIQAQNGEGPSPTLFLSVMNNRSTLKPDPELGSLRGILAELRSLATSLEWQEGEGSSRARAELELVSSVLDNASRINAEQAKVSSALEREVEMFRDTMNNRLEYYRQLQQISDTVAPYDEESVGKPLNETLFADKLQQENDIDEKISGLRAKGRYLIHLRDEPESDDSSRICIICQMSFEIGVLTVCGHKYCKDCLRMWWRQHRTCPVCKKRLKFSDFHQITYRPQDLVVQEEKNPAKIEPERSLENSIYTDISTSTLREIKNIEIDGFHGTKIDTLIRHILWLRVHDPGSKSVLFSQYKGFLDVLGTACSRYKIGYSSIDSKNGIEDFKSDPAVECFLLHARAHSSGLNLVNATHVFLCEPLINTAIELQAIARVHRIGQHRPTTVWMYLVSGTVEESIYDLSVSRRLTHIVAKRKEEESRSSAHLDGFEDINETAIDSANSMEMQDATLASLMTGGASGGELVREDDLWQCLFGDPSKKKEDGHPPMGAGSEVGRFLRAEAAEQRAEAAPTPVKKETEVMDLT